eukprot:TRINITY_DN64557_c0_g1_i1.p1 TRINITY_DN64557_c0_g1~~TRINITY_DN64557_c0_g1_i1.p1  ORF type:complete len:529 (+),score=138.97 TRINITY_DN64557_c0_g1_i1:76-1662(+)
MSAGGSSGQNFCSSNAGFSGTPLWKLKQQGQVPGGNIFKEQEEAKEAAAREEKEIEAAAETFRVAVDAVSAGRTDLNLVRHLIVKDLRKVAARSKIQLPYGGLFENRAPLQLFALFDGQSSAEGVGPNAAEVCAKALLPKLLRNMSVIPQGYENATFLKACLKKAFEDLDKEVLRNQPGVQDGCGGAVALLVAGKLFTAVCGQCELILIEASPKKGNKQVPSKVINMGENQGNFGVADDAKFLKDNGGMVFPGQDGRLMTSNPAGKTTAISRSIGDRGWKGSMGGVAGSLKLVRSVPETRYQEVSWGEKHIGLLLTSAPVAVGMSKDQSALTITDYELKPRAASGEIACKAAVAPQNVHAQCTALVVQFVPINEKASQEPAAKKAKKEAESVRLRHIVVKHMDCGQPWDPVRNQQVMRSSQEAEAILRQALQDLVQEAKTIRLPAGKKASTAALQPTPKFTSLCKEISECTTAQKGGGMMGDLGWLQPDQLQKQFGPAFAEAAKNLQPGQWSDLCASEIGIHIFQRIA